MDFDSSLSLPRARLPLMISYAIVVLHSDYVGVNLGLFEL